MKKECGYLFVLTETRQFINLVNKYNSDIKCLIKTHRFSEISRINSYHKIRQKVHLYMLDSSRKFLVKFYRIIVIYSKFTN